MWAAPSKPSNEKKLSIWKVLDEFRRRLANVTEVASPKQKQPGGPERKLLEDDYMRLKERLKANPHHRYDALSKYLDRMGAIFHR